MSSSPLAQVDLALAAVPGLFHVKIVATVWYVERV